MINMLAKLANRLDALGHFEEANEVDSILRSLANVKCGCDCTNCEYAANFGGFGNRAQQYHNKCQTGKCTKKV